jgi:tRNA threonylcarbamoyladenosine biosynthesis protein TsaE
MEPHQTINSLDELAVFAARLVERLRASRTNEGAAIATLSGDLGAGKTTLTQAIARELGVSQAVRSPTFIISKEYPLDNQQWQSLVHIDAYRLDGEPLEPLGLEEQFSDSSKLIIIEWPEYLESILPTERTDITITLQDDDARTIDINTDN